MVRRSGCFQNIGSTSLQSPEYLLQKFYANIEKERGEDGDLLVNIDQQRNILLFLILSHETAQSLQNSILGGCSIRTLLRMPYS